MPADTDGVHDIEPEDRAAVTLAAQRLAARARGALGPRRAAGGEEVGPGSPFAQPLERQPDQAGRRQTVFHFHMHVVPCNDDDPLRLQWLPGPGDPDEIATAAKLLKGGL